MTGKRGSIVVGLLVVTAGLAVVAPASAVHSDTPTIYSEEGDGPQAWGMTVDREQGGDLAIDVIGEGPQTGQVLGAGGVVYDDSGNPQFLFTFQFLTSPDRAQVAPLTTDAEGEPAPLVQGQMPDNVDVWVATKGEQLPAVAETDAETCPLFCYGLTDNGADAGERLYQVWMGGVSDTTLEVHSPTPGDVGTVTGDATVLGTAEIDDGPANGQIQQTAVDVDDPFSLRATLGVKALLDVTTTTTVDDSLWGVWGKANFKTVCQFATVNCIYADNALAVCHGGEHDVDRACGTSSISWQGPGGEGSAEDTFFFHAEEPGEYAFTIDYLLDAYGPRTFETDTGTYVLAGEHAVFANVADVGLPS